MNKIISKKRLRKMIELIVCVCVCLNVYFLNYIVVLFQSGSGYLVGHSLCKKITEHLIV